jgi:hypothetical protein
MYNWIVLALGLFILAIGLMLRRKPTGGYAVRLGHRAWSIFGDINQTSGAISSTGSDKTQNETAHRDWVGWSISAVGTIIAILQVLKIVS